MKWAIRGKKTYRMHRGKSKGPTTKTGKENSRAAALKHGGYTKEALEQNRKWRDLIRQSKELIQSLDLE
ncbi:MAG: hypothetical protein P0S93_00580 [Candidatus Neptunochlamydia sp.]|nr:hypothetical protein [Candidatus Neptunochlamydia sp.]